MSAARFLIEDLLVKSKEENESLKEENKNINLTEESNSSQQKREEIFNNNKFKSEQFTNELISFKSLTNQLKEQKKQENGYGIAPAWFLSFNQQNKGINNLLMASNNLKPLHLPTQQFNINNFNNKSNLNLNNNISNFFPFFGHFINNNIYPKSTQQNFLKIQNNQKRKGGQIRFSNEQTDVLERTFDAKRYLNNIERKRLSRTLKLSERQVKTWFQNRRAKHRRQAPAEEDSPLTENTSFTQIRQNDLFNTHNYLESVD